MGSADNGDGCHDLSAGVEAACNTTKYVEWAALGYDGKIVTVVERHHTEPGLASLIRHSNLYPLLVRHNE